MSGAYETSEEFNFKRKGQKSFRDRLRYGKVPSITGKKSNEHLYQLENVKPQVIFEQ